MLFRSMMKYHLDLYEISNNKINSYNKILDHITKIFESDDNNNSKEIQHELINLRRDLYKTKKGMENDFCSGNREIRLRDAGTGWIRMD